MREREEKSEKKSFPGGKFSTWKFGNSSKSRLSYIAADELLIFVRVAWRGEENGADMLRWKTETHFPSFHWKFSQNLNSRFPLLSFFYCCRIGIFLEFSLVNSKRCSEGIRADARALRRRKTFQFSEENISAVDDPKFTSFWRNFFHPKRAVETIFSFWITDFAFTGNSKDKYKIHMKNCWNILVNNENPPQNFSQKSFSLSLVSFKAKLEVHHFTGFHDIMTHTRTASVRMSWIKLKMKMKIPRISTFEIYFKSIKRNEAKAHTQKKRKKKRKTSELLDSRGRWRVESWKMYDNYARRRKWEKSNTSKKAT